MTEVSFYHVNGSLSGFKITGHATKNAADETGRLVCAAVSSAAFMAANTLSEVIGAKTVATVQDGYLSVTVKSRQAQCEPVLRGLLLHMNQLAGQYKGHITVHSEV